MTFEQIKPAKISDAIVDQLKNMILEGVLKPGEKLPAERDLAQQLNVSRPSLRDAILRLQTLGLVEVKQGGGTFVNGVVTAAFTEPLVNLLETNPDAAIDYTEFRRAIEATGAYYAAIRATDSDRKILKATWAAMEEAHKLEDPSVEAEVDADLHLAIAEASHNVILLHIAQGLFRLLRQGVFYNRQQLYFWRQARQTLLEQHRTLYQAVLDGDPTSARTAAETHMTYVQDTMREMGRDEMREEISRKRLERLLETKKISLPSDQEA